MQNNSNAISIILPNYNGRSLLMVNIPSIIESLQFAKCNYEIIVIDDCSQDDSVNMLMENFPEVTIIQNQTNQGFSTTCNRGILVAKFPLLCICNTDVTFTKEYFSLALPYFQNNSNLFALKGSIVNYIDSIDNIMNIEKTTQLYFKRGFYRFNNRVEYDSKPLTGKLYEQFVLLGCVFVCDKNKMLELKGFDEIFSPFYWEDSDLAMRALRSGYTLAYAPECVVYHQTSSTIGTYRSYTKRRLVSMRNKFLFSWRHMDSATLWIKHLNHTLISLLTRWIMLDWKYYVAFFTALARINRL